MSLDCRTLILAIAIATGALPLAAVAGGGTVVKLDGTAVIERKATQVVVGESTPLYSGDTLAVKEGVAQVRFEDDSIFVVPGASRLRIDSFKMPSASSGGTAIYTLVDGGVRTITGSVSKGSKDQYELRTEEGTVTVAGSAYLAIRCQGSCARKYKAGLYVKGESGVIFMTNAAGKLKLQRGQTGYASGNTSLATRVKVSPFDDPAISAEYGVAAEFDAEVHPPRIEPEPPASPS